MRCDLKEDEGRRRKTKLQHVAQRRTELVPDGATNDSPTTRNHFSFCHRFKEFFFFFFIKNFFFFFFSFFKLTWFHAPGLQKAKAVMFLKWRDLKQSTL